MVGHPKPLVDTHMGQKEGTLLLTLRSDGANGHSRAHRRWRFSVVREVAALVWMFDVVQVVTVASVKTTDEPVKGGGARTFRETAAHLHR